MALAFLLIVLVFVVGLIVLFTFPPSFMVQLMQGNKPKDEKK